MLSYIWYTTLLVSLATLAQAAQSTVPKTHNQKQAAALQASAVFLKPGRYTFTNVATGQKLYYVPKGNHIYPAKLKSAKSAAVMSVTPYSDRKVPWIRLHFGNKNKCLSSAWGGVDNDSAVAYVCASGQNSQTTTLERTKQWWIAVPVNSKLKAPAKTNTYANAVLLAAQSDSIKTRNKKIAAQKAAFGRRSLEFMKHSRGGHEQLTRRMRTRARISRRTLAKRAKTAGAGTYWFFATDHMLDMPARALTGKVYKARGIKSTVLDPWKKNQKNQQWRVTRA